MVSGGLFERRCVGCVKLLCLCACCVCELCRESHGMPTAIVAASSTTAALPCHLAATAALLTLLCCTVHDRVIVPVIAVW